MDTDHWGIEQEEQNDSPLASVLQYGTSTNPVLKQAALIYAATTDVITLEVARGPAAPTAYFAAFLSAMQQKGKHSADALAALCYLLARIYPLVPPSVICVKVPVTADLFIDILKQHAEIIHVTKNLLFCIAKNLRVLGAQNMKSLCSPPALKMLRALFVFSVDPRPKIRRNAQKNCSVFFKHMAAQKEILPKPVWEAVVTFVESELSVCSRNDCQTALHLCGLLKDVIQYLPTTAVAKIVAPLLQLAAEGNPYLVLQSFNVLANLFNYGLRVSRTLAVPGSEATQLMQDLSITASEMEVRINRDAEFVENVLMSTVDLKPNTNDIAASGAFTRTFKNGLAILYTLSPAKALARAVTFFELIANSFTSEKPEVAMSAAAALRGMVKVLMNKNTVAQAVQDESHVLNVVMKLTQDLFNMRLRPSWFQSLSVAQAAIAACPGPEATPIVRALLLVVDGLHRTTDNKDLQLAAEKIVGAALQSIGPEALLSVLPLGLPVPHESVTVVQQLEHARPWILPLMSLNVKNTSLGFFMTHLLPCADTQLQLAAHAIAEQRVTEARTVLTLAEQVWDALPAFATLPTDLAKVFKPFAKKLVEYMQSDDTAFAQPMICKALRLLAAKNVAIAEGRWGQGDDLGLRRFTLDDEEEDADAKKKTEKKDSSKVRDDDNVEDDDDDTKEETVEEEEVVDDDSCPISRETAQENVRVMGQVAKNLLPLLFNLASSSQPEDRVAVLDAILAYTRVADANVKATLFKRALEKFIESTTALNDGYAKLESQDEEELDPNDPNILAKLSARVSEDQMKNLADTAKALTDILMSMAPALDAQCLELLLRAIISHFNSADGSMQKKAYQAVGHVVTVNQDVFMLHWKETVRALTIASANVMAPAVKTRMVCAMRIYSNIPNLLSHPEVVETLPAIISEAILASKENNSKTRDAAFELVSSIARRLVHVDQTQQGSNLLTEYLYMVLAGLAASTPRMKSGTITMLARLVYEFHSSLSQELVVELFTTICVMIQSKTREIIKALMGFVKIAISTLDVELLRPQVHELLKAFSEWPAENKSRFKRRVRIVFTILVKKFGFDFIRNVTPETDVRLVDYLRKQQNRQQNSKDAAKKDVNRKMTDEEEEEKSIKLKTGLSFEEFLRMDDDDEDLAIGGTLNAAQLLQSQVGNKRRKSSKADEDNVYINENVDFMDDAAGKHISMNKKPEQRGVNMAEIDEATNARLRKRIVPMTEGGKIDVTKLNKIMAREEEDTKRIRRQAQNAENPQVALKRKREDRAKELQDQQSQRKASSVGRAYASEKAGGDARKRGQKHDPYAYVPLDPRTLNKRKAGSHTQAATYAAAFADKKQGKQLGQKMSKSQRHALRKKGGRHGGSDE